MALKFWQAKLTPGQSSVLWKKDSPQSLLHVTMACFAEGEGNGKKDPVFVRAQLKGSKEKITLCVLRWEKVENKSLELFFDGDVRFSISGGSLSVQLTGQSAGPVAEQSSNNTTSRTSRNSRTSSNLLSLPSSSDDDEDLAADDDDDDYKPESGGEDDSASEQSDDEDEDNDASEQSDEDVSSMHSSSKRKAASAPAERNQKQRKLESGSSAAVVEATCLPGLAFSLQAT